MITNLKISNIQSHENSELEFHPGVNIIIGNTDSGKTAIIRALRWAVWNRPSGDSLRSTWGGLSLIRVTTKEGYVIRSKDKQDKYTLNLFKQKKLLFTAFGTSVPEEINGFFNINEINLQEQLDNHFLLGKGWTPGSVAAHFNKVANISKIDTSTSNVNKKIAKLESDIKYDKEQVLEKQTALLSFEYLDTAESLLEVLEDQKARLTKFYSSRNKLQVKIDDINDLYQIIEKAKEGLIVEDFVNILLNQIERKEKLDAKKTKLQNIIESVEEKQTEIKELSHLTNLSSPVTEILKDITEKESQINKQKLLFKTITSIRNIKTQLNLKKERYTHLVETFNREFPDVCLLCGQLVEKWKSVRNYEGLYEVSSFGKIKSYYGKGGNLLLDSQIKEPDIDADGYKRVILYNTKQGIKLTSKAIHRLVLETFVGDCPKNMEGSHLDNDPGNNHLDNLVWESHTDNERRKIRKPRMYRICTKLTELEIAEIRKTWSKRFTRPRTYTELAELFDVTDGIIKRMIEDELYHGWDYIPPVPHDKELKF